MTPQEIKEFEDGLRWEAERNRRIVYARQRKLEKLVATLNNVTIIILAVLAAAILIWLASRQKTEERAAYLEGRYGLSHAVALDMASHGFGKSADDILKEVR